MLERFEDLLVVHDMAGECPDERYGLRTHRADELLRFIPVLEHVVRDTATPDRIDLLTVAIAQYGAIERQVAHVGDDALIASLLKVFAEDAEFIDHTHIQIVADGKAGMRYLILEGFIDRDEFADPAFEELARLKLVMRGRSA